MMHEFICCRVYADGRRSKEETTVRAVSMADAARTFADTLMRREMKQCDIGTLEIGHMDNIAYPIDVRVDAEANWCRCMAIVRVKIEYELCWGIKND